jgi:hypothetical protein
VSRYTRTDSDVVDTACGSYGMPFSAIQSMSTNWYAVSLTRL